MKKSNVVNLSDLFGSGEALENSNNRKNIINIKAEKLYPFKNHPFKLYEGERLKDMVESIKEFGIITPIIVRPKRDDKYEILSGHNRANAGAIAGLDEIPAVVIEELTDEEAMLIVTETNLIQRSFSELSHSEKARILVERHNAIKEQGKRTDLIGEIESFSINNLEDDQDEEKHSDKKVAAIYDLSPRMVSRYLRIDTLTDAIKVRLDRGEIPLYSAVDLSFLKADEQDHIEKILSLFKYRINLKKSNLLKAFSVAGSLDFDKTNLILSGKYFDKAETVKNIKLKPKLVNKYFTKEQTAEEIEEVIDNALELYFSNEIE